MTFEDYKDIVERASESFRLDINLLRAIITVESHWQTYSNRFEPTCPYSNNVRTFADKLIISYDTELNNQHTSYGLGHVLGVTARDLGFTDHIPMLCDPTIGVFYCAKYLQKQSQRYHDESDVIAAYNAGSAIKTPGGFYKNQDYLNKVYAELSKLRKLN